MTSGFVGVKIWGSKWGRRKSLEFTKTIVKTKKTVVITLDITPV